MSNLSYKSIRNAHFAVVLVLAVVLIIGQPAVNGLVSQVILDGFYYPFFHIKKLLTEVKTVSAENDQLRSWVAKSSVELSFLEEAARENIRLRSILGFEQQPGYRLLPATVVSVTGGRMPISATINRGLADSVKVQQPVINQVGLVGRIQEVMPGYAKVQLLTDPLNRVAARVASGREMGIVRYLVSEGMVLDNFPNQGIVRPGDTILSSGLGRVYPPGLKVGTVREIFRPENKPYSEIRLEPAVNFHSLEELFVLMPETQ
ncbi:MAG: rod shape-determining protein MreC [candidate division Zixibacteria bacterium]|nr:rod shape-determining protein MreC [candidate division Zixibacteria bacterium]